MDKYLFNTKIASLLFKISIISVILVALSSCEKYLDVKQNSQIGFLETVNDCQLFLNDYARMNIGYPFDGETSSDDYFVTDATLFLDQIQTDDRELYSWQPNAIRDKSDSQWLFPYHVIYRANLVLETLDKIGSSPNNSEINDVRGQALFFRAYGLWSVAQLYAAPFVNGGSNSSPGVPIRLSSDINDKSVRGTVADTYGRIIDDLTQASNLLPTTMVVPSRPNKVAALAMLARVSLAMGNYANALNYADASLKIYNKLLDFNTITDTTSFTPFSRFNVEVIFQAVMKPGSLAGPQIENSSTLIGKINPAVISSYDEDDLRLSVFFQRNTGVTDGSYRFTGNYEPASDSKFFTGLAVDELYLIRAECYARAGNLGSALTDLNTLLQTRWRTGSFVALTASSADEALALILQERRKELIMRGLRWTDLRRLNTDPRFAVTLSRTINSTTYTLAPNDLRYTLLIPQEVITISGIAQNAR